MSLETSARLVALHHKIGTADRRHEVPLAHPPKLIEVDYARVLVGMIGDWRKAIQPLMDALPHLIADARRYRSDDTSEGRRTRALLDRSRYVITRQAEQAPFIAKRYADQAAQQQSREFSRQTKAALGVELQTLDHAVPTRIGHFAHENAQLIRSLGDHMLGEVGNIVARGFTNNQTVDEIAAEIQGRFDVAESRARFIARDQLTKLTADVTRMRHREVGIATFRWNARPGARPSHAAKADRIFPYEGSSAPSFFPGEEPGCRCQAVPIFDEIRMAAGIKRRR